MTTFWHTLFYSCVIGNNDIYVDIHFPDVKEQFINFPCILASGIQ